MTFSPVTKIPIRKAKSKDTLNSNVPSTIPNNPIVISALPVNQKTYMPAYNNFNLDLSQKKLFQYNQIGNENFNSKFDFKLNLQPDQSILLNGLQSKISDQIKDINKSGNIFKISRLPDTNDDREYVRYDRKPDVFKTFIQINKLQAEFSNLSYFQTMTINKYYNSDSAYIERGYQVGYVNLLSTSSNVDIKFDKNYTSNIFGRSVKFASNFIQKDLKDFSQRQVYNFKFGVSLEPDENNELIIKEKQEILFQCQERIISDFNKCDYDLYVFAFNKNNEIIDIKKLNNESFNTLNVNWSIDKISSPIDFRNIDFNKLFVINFNREKYNNLFREGSISLTSYGLGLPNLPIESVSIAENSYDFEDGLFDIPLENIISEKINFKCNRDLRFEISNPFKPIRVAYNFYFKINGTSQFFIQNEFYEITDVSQTQLISQSRNINDYLKCDLKYYLFESILSFNLFLDNNNIRSLNLNIIKIIVNDNHNINYADKIYTQKPTLSNLPDLNLIGNNLNSILKSYDNLYPFYIKLNDSFKNITFIFEQNFELYQKKFENFQTIIDQQNIINNFKQQLIITDSNLTANNDTSSFNIEYSINLNSVTTQNNNFNKYVKLGYDNIFLDELKASIGNLSDSFLSDFYIIVKKETFRPIIYDNLNKKLADELNKTEYFLFNSDLNFSKDFFNFEELNIKLKFNDNQNLMSFFSHTSDMINTYANTTTRYTFSAKIFTIPPNFFNTSNEYVTKLKIKDTVISNANINALPSQQMINNIYMILNKINNNTINAITKFDMENLYNLYCFNESEASNKKTIASSNVVINRVFENKIVIKMNNEIKRFNQIMIGNNTGYYSIIPTQTATKLDAKATMLLLNSLKSAKNIIENVYIKIKDKYEIISNLLKFNYADFLYELNRSVQIEFDQNNENLNILISINPNVNLKNIFSQLTEKLNNTTFKKLYFKMSLDGKLIVDKLTVNDTEKNDYIELTI